MKWMNDIWIENKTQERSRNKTTLYKKELIILLISHVNDEMFNHRNTTNGKRIWEQETNVITLS